MQKNAITIFSFSSFKIIFALVIKIIIIYTIKVKKLNFQKFF